MIKSVLLRQRTALVHGCAALLAFLAQPAEAADEPEHGLSVEATYTAELLAGAGSPRIEYVDNFDLKVEYLTDDTRVFAYALYNNGQDFSGPRFPRGFVASNLETGVQALRLYEAWIEQQLFDDRVSLRVGLYDLNAEFDALESAGLFFNPAHGIGTDLSQSGRNGPSIFPVTSLAARIEARLDAETLLRVAVLDAVPGDPANPARTAIKLGNGDGALLIGEVDRQFGDWRVIAGYWRYTAPFEDLLDSAIAGVPVERKGAQGAYLRGEGLLRGTREGQGLDGFFRLGWADGRFHETEKFGSGGLVWRGPLASREDDSAGVAFAWAGISDRARRALALGGETVSASEWAFEATYALALTKWFSVQPSLQYVLNPAFERDRRAVVGSLRFTAGHRF